MKYTSKHQLTALAILLFATLFSIELKSQCSQFNPMSGLCENSGKVTLIGGNPAPGVYFGNHVSNGKFNTTTAGIGAHTIAYSASSCSDTVYQTIVVNSKPKETIVSNPLPTPNPPLHIDTLIVQLCDPDTVFVTHSAVPMAAFTILPALYVKFLPGGAEFFPPESMKYDLIALASNGCSDTTSIKIDIVPKPKVINGGTYLYAETNGGKYQWLDCDLNLTSIAGETNQYFGPQKNGNYAVEIQKGICKADTSTCYNFINTGLDELDLNNEIFLFPNPTSGRINIDLKKESQNVKVIIANIYGQAVLEKQFLSLKSVDVEIPGNPGIYLISIFENDTLVTFKVVKE